MLPRSSTLRGSHRDLDSYIRPGSDVDQKAVTRTSAAGDDCTTGVESRNQAVRFVLGSIIIEYFMLSPLDEIGAKLEIIR